MKGMACNVICNRYYLALVCLAGSAFAAPFAFDLATDGLFFSYWPRYMAYWARLQSMTDPDGWYIRWPVKGYIPRPETFMFPR